MNNYGLMVLGHVGAQQETLEEFLTHSALARLRAAQSDDHDGHEECCEIAEVHLAPSLLRWWSTKFACGC